MSEQHADVADRDEAGQPDYVCPTCSLWAFTTAETAVPVWESPEEYEAGDDPDYVGCLACSTMEAFDATRHVR